MERRNVKYDSHARETIVGSSFHKRSQLNRQTNKQPKAKIKIQIASIVHL